MMSFDPVARARFTVRVVGVVWMQVHCGDTADDARERGELSDEFLGQIERQAVFRRDLRRQFPNLVQDVRADKEGDTSAARLLHAFTGRTPWIDQRLSENDAVEHRAVGR